MEFEELKRERTLTWFEMGQQTAQTETVYGLVLLGKTWLCVLIQLKPTEALSISIRCARSRTCQYKP